MEEEKSIFHFGVLGMKWGRRKSRPSSDDRKVLTDIRGKKAHELSNLQIRKAAERIQLEKQYKDLTTKSQNSVVKAVNEILSNQGKTMFAAFVSTSAALAVKYVMENRETIADNAANLIKIIPKGG